MFETFIGKLIEELGATGTLVIGLYFLLYKPLTSMTKHTNGIHSEIKQIYRHLKEYLITEKIKSKEKEWAE